MREIDKSTWPKYNENENQLYFVFFYTKMCGTCQLGEKMLTVLEKVVDMEFYKCNINFIGDLSYKWKIESVPCFSVWRNGEMIEKVYAFHSVEYLYEQINKYK